MLRILLTIAIAFAYASNIDEFLENYAPPRPDPGVESVLIEAETSVYNMLKKGATESDCKDLAKTLCKDVESEIDKNQKVLDKLEDGSKCLKLGQTAVENAKKEYEKWVKEHETAKKVITTIKNSKVVLGAHSFTTLKEGTCGTFFSSTSYTTTKRKYEEAVKKETLVKGKVTEAGKSLKAAKEAAKREVKKCLCATKKTRDLVWNRLSSVTTRTKQEEAHGKCTMMNCVLNGTPPTSDSCKSVLTTLKKKTLISEAESVSGCETCACEELLQTGAFISTYKIKDVPASTSALIPHPGKVVNIAYRVSSKSKNYFPSYWKNFYGDSKLYKVTQLTRLQDAPADTDLMYDIIPAKLHDAAEIATLNKFLDSGGRLIVIGEHSGYAKAANVIISKTVKTLGGGVEILVGSLTGAPFTRARKEINNVPLASGIKEFKHAAWAPLKVDDSVSEIVLANQAGKIMMADQLLKKGRLTVWADVNPFQYTPTNTPMFRNLAHQARGFKEVVKKGGDPNKGGPNKKPEKCKC